MPDKDNQDDLYIEEDLAADFLNEANLDAEISALTGTDSPKNDAVVKKQIPADEKQTSADRDSKAAPKIPANDTNDWVEDEKVDLPGQLALDIYETKDHLVVLCRVAGVAEKNIDVSISANNILTIRGSLLAKIEENVENHFIQECYWGEFSRSVSLPVDVKKEDINATLENGILKIIFVKIHQDAIKKIDIKTSR